MIKLDDSSDLDCIVVQEYQRKNWKCRDFIKKKAKHFAMPILSHT
jgi:hypothetical protein